MLHLWIRLAFLRAATKLVCAIVASSKRSSNCFPPGSSNKNSLAVIIYLHLSASEGRASPAASSQLRRAMLQVRLIETVGFVKPAAAFPLAG